MKAEPSAAGQEKDGPEEEIAKLCCFWGEKQQMPVFLCLKLLQQQQGLTDLPKKQWRRETEKEKEIKDDKAKEERCW